MAAERPLKTTKCSQHPAKQAAWRCRECQRALCPACAENDRRGNSVFARCRICGQMADWLMVPKDLNEAEVSARVIHALEFYESVAPKGGGRGHE